jgi:hypothetical protein
MTEPTTLTATVPLLLFPFRVETRFVADVVNASVAEGPALLLRVYPDTVSVSAFESALTADEISAGQTYWTQVWLAGSPPPDTDAAQATWRVLAATYGRRGSHSSSPR